MRAVDDDIREAALSAGRHIAVDVELAAKAGGEYVTKQTLTDKSEIEYLKISVGGDSDGATIGKTYCAQLVIKIPRYIDIAETDRLIVRVGYDTGAETSTGKMSLGWFYVDNIAINGYVATVTAFDKMLRGSKNYVSTLDYPAVLPNVLDEVCTQMGLSLDSSVTVPNYTINTPPIRGKDKDGNTLYYSKREMLGFIGSLAGGNWYIDAGGHLSLAKLADAVDTALAANVFESDINADVFTVTGIAWNTGNQTYKRQDVDARGVIEFYNPLDVTHEPILAALEMALVGKSYYGGSIKRQGAGWHEIGDVVAVPIDKNDNTKPIMLTGIERVIQNGGYTENWKSCAQTESEANYTVDSGTDVSITGEAECFPLSEYEYLTDLSAKCNGVTYTAEKDADTGLISKINDSNGNEFEPTINSGITDTAFHNAVLMAVAMARGIGGSSAPKPVIELLFNGNLENTGSGEYTIEPSTDSTEIMYASGLNGKCYAATNTSEIDIVDVSALLISDFTITFWVKIDSTGLSPYAQYRRFIWWTANNAYRGLEVSYSGSTSTNVPSFVLTGGVNGGNASSAINDGTWHSITIVQRGDAIITTVDQKEQIIWNNCTLSPVINCLSLSHVKYALNGYISGFRVFDRALNYPEIERVLALK